MGIGNRARGWGRKRAVESGGRGRDTEREK